MCTCNVVFITVGVIGVVLVVLGSILGFAVIPPIIDDQIAENVRLEPGTDQYDRWVTTPMAFQFKVNIFNVTNPDEIMKGGKPVVKEQGPYIYNIYRKKVDISYDEEFDTYEYLQNSYFTFDEEGSAPLTLEDTVTVLNVPLQGAFQKSEDLSMDSSTINKYWQSMFDDTTTLFHTINVKEYLFGGYRFCDPNKVTGLAKTACSKVLAQGIETITEQDGFAVFSFFNHKQNKNDGPYVINAGMKDPHQVGAIQKWEGKVLIDQWIDDEESECNTIRGRDSAIYPPYNNDTSAFDVFNTDICRIVTLRVQNESSYKGVDSLVATLGVDNLMNSDTGKCYCTKGIKNLDGERECLPTGFGDLSSCTGAAVVMSFPHFLYAESDYTKTVEGLSPDPELHKTFVQLQPGTGTPLEGIKRMQFNIIIRPMVPYTITENLTPAILPILWVEEGVQLTDDLIAMIDDIYLSKLVLVDAVVYTIIGVGALLIAIGLLGYILKRCCC